jgi:hypothetical protein
VKRSPLGRRPLAAPPRHEPSAADLAAAAERVRYIGSPKHKFGATAELGPGRPGIQPLTLEQARVRPPVPPFTMICPAKWNRRDPAREATALLKEALMNGQVSPFKPGLLPKHVYARDPEDRSVVYCGHLMSGEEGSYKGYPLTDAEIDDLDIDLP